MKTYDRIALLFSIAAVIAAIFVSSRVYENIPHIEDEITYVWQARLAAAGLIKIESPACPSCFLQPFVIDLDGWRFGKYPPGWPAALSLGVRLGARSLVNPLLAGLYVWLNYLLVRKILNPTAGLLATGLTVLSPFFLMNAGTLLAHAWSLMLVAAFAHAWLDALDPDASVPRWMTILVGGLTLGLLLLTRPLTAAGIGLPFFVHGLVVLLRGPAVQKRAVITVGFIAAMFVPLYLLWQYAVTGNLFQNPYELYWPYDKIGFGPGIGLHPDGHQLKYALVNTRFSLGVGLSDLFGWPRLSWLFLPFGLVALRRNPRGLLVSSVIVSLVLAYGLYWIGSWLIGPRYYVEGLLSLTLLTAAGVLWLAGQVTATGNLRRLQQARFVGVATVFILFVLGNLFFYLPARLGSLKGLYGIRASQLAPFQTTEAQALTPALVIVQPHDYWLEYGALLDLSSPLLNTPFIFAYNRGTEQNQKAINAYPDRTVIFYRPDQPYVFYLPRE